MAVLDFVFDILTLVLPIPVISRLQTGKRQMYSIIGIFWLGFICVIASALRIYYTHAFLSIDANSSEAWITSIVSANSLWVIIEANFSIIAVCLPTLSGSLKSRLTT
ncbi:hypothetical protein N7G274_003368 [Stereocaulon virgatum]|uniref:Rhodopsin domain-containing protein n=1 Tax=Stereocaulon virgatum TaxID=373712 RepID=A0ABR4AFJ1_9LECA